VDVLNYILWYASWKAWEPLWTIRNFFLKKRYQPPIKILPTGLQCTLPVPCFTQTIYLFARWNGRIEQFSHEFSFHIRNIETEYQPILGMSAHHIGTGRVRPVVYNIVNRVVFYARYVLCTSLGQTNTSHVFCWSKTCVPFQIWRCAALMCVTDSMKQSPTREAKTSSTLSWTRNPLLFMESVSSLTCSKTPSSVPVTSHTNPAQCILTTYCHIILPCICSY
jgi:hypothetical protein